MELNDVMMQRRSIRRYSDKPITKDVIEQILYAGSQAPSSKNRQPWRYVVVMGQAKEGMLKAMDEGLSREQRGMSLLPNSQQYMSGAYNTRSIMAQAPATIFVLNTLGSCNAFATTEEDRFYEWANIQSIGASIQNMILTATDLGLGSLWNCDIFFAHQEMQSWLDTNEQVIACFSIGYQEENPEQRPRKPLESLVTWLE